MEEDPSIKSLVLESERLLDAVLLQQLRKVQSQQQEILRQILEVEQLRDHLPLLEKQRRFCAARRTGLSQTLERLRIKPPAPKPLHPPPSASEEETSRDPFPLKCLADIGAHCYLPAIADDAQRLLISVGFNFYLEMTFSEATNFLERKLKCLHERHDVWARKCAELKAQIHVLMEAITAISEQPMLQEML